MPKLISRLRYWLPILILVLTLSFYPLVGMVSVLLNIVNSTPIAIGYRFIYLALSLVLLLTYLPSLPKRKINIALIGLSAFWFFYTGRILNDLFIEQLSEGYASKGGAFFLAYGLGGCFIPALAIGMAARDIDYKRLGNYLLFFFFASNAAIAGYLLYYYGFSFSLFYTRLRLGENSTISPIALSQYGGALLVAAAATWLIIGKRNVYLPFLMLLGSLLIVMGASRGPLLAAAVVLGVILFDHFWIKAKKLAYWLMVGGTAIVFAGFVGSYIIPNLDEFVLFSRLSGTIEEGRGLDARGLQWSSAWNQFLSSPLWGDRIVERALNYYPHNMILDVLMSTGLLGFLSLLPAFGMVFFRFLKRSAFAPERRVFFYLFIFFFGCAMFSLSIITIAHVWILLMLVVTMPIKNEYKNA